MEEQKLAGTEHYVGKLYELPATNERENTNEKREMSEPIHRREVVLLENPDQVSVDVHQVMNPLHPDVYNSLKESIWTEGILVPILLDKEWAVIDGHNRIQCWKDLLADGVEIGKVPAVVYDAATKYDAYRIAVTTNSVRRDPSELKPELVRKQLLWLDHMYEAAGDPPDARRSWSDKRIASTIGIRDKTVKHIREEMEDKGEIAVSTRRVGVMLRDGKRSEFTRDLAKDRAAAEQSIAKPKDETSVPARRGGLVDNTPPPEPAKIKIGRKEMTPEEIKEELKKLREDKKEANEKAKAERERLKEVELGIDDLRETMKNNLQKQLADIYARYDIEESPSIFEVPEEVWREELEGTRSKREMDAMRVLMDAAKLSSRMLEYEPVEAARAFLNSSRSDDRTKEIVHEMLQWLGDVIKELDKLTTKGQLRAVEGNGK